MNLKDYIRGQRHGTEANRLERDAMNDPFLSDAIDGYDSAPGNHSAAIERLEKQCSSHPKRLNRHIAWRIGLWAAAALLLLVGIPFLLQQPEKEIHVASSEKIERKPPVPFSEEISEPILADTHKQKTPKTAPKRERPSAGAKEAEPENRPMPGKIDESVVSESALPQEEQFIEEEEKNLHKPIKTSMEIMPEKEATPPAAPENTKTVRGRIVDEAGEPVIGATVIIKNSKEAAVTDIDGNFTLDVLPNRDTTLIASYVGMKNVEVPAKELAGDITMKADDQLLEEVIVVGYGTKRKSRRTGSASKLKTESPPFGEKEFIDYFRENCDKTLCPGTAVAAKVECYIDENGRISDIRIKETSCPPLQTEIKRLLLGSPPWSKRNRRATLNITL